ncbi:MAG: nitrilase-related carbon-nitrogen hydrolase, partial [Steroidobacteraceae bacterium]
WYERAVPDFESATVGAARVGMLIGLELWIPDQAKRYGEDGVHIVAVPRVDQAPEAQIGASNDEWLAGGRTAAVASGAYCVSSSRGGRANNVGGVGWIIAPDGRTLALTSSDEPYVSAEVDLAAVSRRARA